MSDASQSKKSVKTVTVDAPQFTKSFHQKPYPAIDPLRPELSQKHRTVLVTGASDGIGFAIARAFVKASVARVIITGRRQNALEEAAGKLRALQTGTIIEFRINDFTDSTQTDALWESLNAEGTAVDVLAHNAASFSEAGKILDRNVDVVWQEYEGNVKSALNWTKRFYSQEIKGVTNQKFLVYTSTVSIHDHINLISDYPAYLLTRNGATLALQQIAKDTDPKELQVISFHPGLVLTESAQRQGFTDSTPGMSWTHEDVPGHFAVWATTKEAEFLHGRTVWANWDVDELAKGPIREKIDEDVFFLKIGVKGW